MAHLRLHGFGSARGIWVCEDECVGDIILDGGASFCIQGVDDDVRTACGVGGRDGVAEENLSRGIGELEALGGVERVGEDVGDYFGFEEAGGLLDGWLL